MDLKHIKAPRMRALLQGSMMQGLPYSSAQQTQPCRDNNIGYTDKVRPNHLRNIWINREEKQDLKLDWGWAGGLNMIRDFKLFLKFANFEHSLDLTMLIILSGKLSNSEISP